MTYRAAFRAIYEGGVFRPLEPVQLEQGTEVTLIYDVCPAVRTQVFPHIIRDPEVLSGRAFVDGTPVRVLDVVRLERAGLPPGSIRDKYPVLTMAQTHRSRLLLRSPG